MKSETHVHEDRRVAAAAERQAHVWAMIEEIEDRKVRVESGHAHAKRLGPFVTISREAGACGSEVAELVGKRMGWEVLDKGLLDHVAERYHLPRGMLELVDETPSNWAFDTLGPWLDHKIITHDRYVFHLCRVVVLAARRGKIVIVGRAARFILPRDQGLGVRLVASEKYRMAQLMRRFELDAPTARRRMEQLEAGRREFVTRFFHHDVADPRQYDLVINVEQVGPQAAAEIIESASRLRQGE